MLRNPLLHLNRKPVGIDAKRDNAEKPPFDVVHKKIATCAIEVGLFAVYDGMVRHPLLPDADGPRGAYAKRNCAQQCHNYPRTDKSGKPAGEF